MKHLIELQALARKHKADMHFAYYCTLNKWVGEYIDDNWHYKVIAPTLTKCISKLYERVRKQ